MRRDCRHIHAVRWFWKDWFVGWYGTKGNCVICGDEFVRTGRQDQRYCSHRCVGRAGKGRKQRRGVIPVAWQERFWRYLAPAEPDACWEWSGSRDHHGYGRLNRGTGDNVILKAHRASYEIHNGPIPDGMAVCHRCDNPPCCNPAHLFLGTMRDNSRDMARKGRSAAQRGYSNGREVLPDEQVRELRERAAAGERHIDLAHAYGIRAQSVAALVYGQRRRSAGGPIRTP